VVLPELTFFPLSVYFISNMTGAGTETFTGKHILLARDPSFQNSQVCAYGNIHAPVSGSIFQHCKIRASHCHDSDSITASVCNTIQSDAVLMALAKLSCSSDQPT
jgi:hypothetical protein